jgi:hypothetical protein
MPGPPSVMWRLHEKGKLKKAVEFALDGFFI